jgi:carboxypeptidase Q
MVGLGMSIGTPGTAPLVAPVLVIAGASPAEAQANMVGNCSAAANKIVLFNVPFTSYGATVGVRGSAGTWAAACGAVAALIRTIGPYSLQNPHTGFTQNASIPTAAVSLEDAAQMQRFQDRGQAISVSLYMESYYAGLSPSRVLLLDLPGATLPGEIVVVSGHGDSWDIAEGAMDDGGGFVSSWEAVRTLAALVKAGTVAPPKRTVRAVVWVNEENGNAGGIQYATNLAPSGPGSLANHSWMMESDSGAFFPFGIGISCTGNSNGGCAAAQAQLTLIGSALLSSIGSGNVSAGGGGEDIDPSCSTGIPCSGLNVLDPRLSQGAINNPCTIDATWSAP